jgi:hypothetical protein
MGTVTPHDPAHEPYTEWSALAAVGVLDGAERTRFDAHLAAGCATCEASLRELTQVVAGLPWALPDVPLRAEVRDQLMARVAAERPRPSTPVSKRVSTTTLAEERHPWRWAGGLVAASLATALVWGMHETRQALFVERGRVSQSEQELAEQRAIISVVAHTDTYVAALRGLGGAAHADGWIVWSPSKREGFMVVHHLPILPPGRQYQLWVIGGAAWAPAGGFQVDAIGHAALTVRADLERPERFAITVEAAALGAVPSGPPVMQGGPSS